MENESILVKVRENLGTFCLLLVGFSTIIVDLFDDQILTPEIIDKVHTAGLFYIIWLFIENSPEKIADKVEENTQNLDSGHNKIESKLAELLSFQKDKICVVNPKQQPEIFKNFKGIYYSINAPLFIENNSVVTEEDIVKYQSARYEDDEFKTIYNIFYSEELNDASDPFYYENALKNFYEFSKKLVTFCKASHLKSRVIILNERAPTYSMYVGEKNIEHTGMFKKGMDVKAKRVGYSVIYFGDEPFTTFNGNPKFAFSCLDEKLNTVLQIEAENMISRNENKKIDLLLPEFVSWYEENYMNNSTEKVKIAS